MLVYSPVQLSRVILNPLYSSFPKAQQDFTGHESFIGKTRLWYFIHEKKKVLLVFVSGILVHCKSVTTVHKYLGFKGVCFYRGIRTLSDCFNIKYNVMFIPYLLYKKTTRYTFAFVTLLDSSLFQMAEPSKLPGPVQIHNTTGTLEKKKGTVSVW